jgi:hypothetical protein
VPVRLPRLPMNWQSQPALFERYWDETLQQVESNINAILALPSIQAAITAAQVAAAAAQSSASAAQSSATMAQNAANVNKKEASLNNSFTSGFTAPLLTSDNTGVVTIKNHNRVYGDSTLNPTVSVVGGTVSTGATPGSTLRFYYVDALRAGGPVSYLFTTDPATPPAQSSNTHSVGAVVVPVVGTGDGETVFPPGFVFL